MPGRVVTGCRPRVKWVPTIVAHGFNPVAADAEKTVLADRTFA